MSGTGRSRMNIERNILTTIEQEQFEALFEDYNLSVEINDDIFKKINDYVMEHSEKKDYSHHSNQFQKIFEPNDSQGSYRFDFLDLPPFRPTDNSFNPKLEDHISFLKSNNVYSIYDLSPVEDFVKNNPVSKKIFEIIKSSRDGCCRWGTLERNIKNDDYLFSLANYDIAILKDLLTSNHRLFNLFTWISFFEPDQYYVWNRESYLADPREGTCSLNLKSKE
jgi:hypothetical protein